MQPPRPPRPGRLPAFSVPGPLRIQAPRTTESLGLDRATGVPFVPWPQFKAENRSIFKRGHASTIVGNNGSGKSVLMRELFAETPFTVLLGTKPRDPELYEAYEKRGFEITESFDASAETDHKKVIFKPRLSTPDRKGVAKQADAFRQMLFEVFEYGGWTVIVDELFYISDTLGLSDTMEMLWTQGRVMNISVIAATQQPVSVPVMAFSEAWNLFLYRQNDRRRINRMAEFSAGQDTVLRDLIPRLPEHEFVYVETRTGKLVRSRVML